MKNKLTKLLLGLALGIGLASVSSIASAYWYGGYYGGPGYYYGGGYYHGGYDRGYYGYRHHSRCRWIPGHYVNGYWYPARRVCWR